MELLDLYERASDWTFDKVTGAANDLDTATPCEGWDVRTLLDHVLEVQRYFAGAARGEDPAGPSGEPPRLVGPDPAADFADVRSEVLSAFGQDGVIERTGPLLGIAFTEVLLHGHDLARATGRQATMPDGLAEAAYSMIHGRFTDAQREGVFGPELPVAEDASAQARLLAYTGRNP